MLSVRGTVPWAFCLEARLVCVCCWLLPHSLVVHWASPIFLPFPHSFKSILAQIFQRVLIKLKRFILNSGRSALFPGEGRGQQGAGVPGVGTVPNCPTLGSPCSKPALGNYALTQMMRILTFTKLFQRSRQQPWQNRAWWMNFISLASDFFLSERSEPHDLSLLKPKHHLSSNEEAGTYLCALVCAHS